MSSAAVRDLPAASARATEDSCDVCIVGAGAAGAYLARRLWQQGIDVVVLEAGGKKGQSAVESGFTPEFPASDYPGAIEGRFFGLGGSTSAWGGLLVPHSRHDLREHDDSAREEAWRQIVAVASRHGSSVLQLLGFDAPPAFEEFAGRHLAEEHRELESAGLSVLSSVFLPFRKKNLFHLLEGVDRPGTPPRIYTHAVAKDWSVDRNGRVDSLTAVSRDGTRLGVRAKRFVVAAGAIESARILLEIQDVLPNGVEISSEVGASLGDHLSVAIADVDRNSLAAATRRYAPRFSGPWMRSFRFMESAPPETAPRAFAHFVFENENLGFELAKKVLTSVQARRVPRVSVGEVVRGFGGLVHLAYARYIDSKLFVPEDAPTRLQLDIEQTPDARNQVRLGDSLDELGRRTAVVDWRIRDEDMDNLRATSVRLLEGWERQRARLPRLVRRELDFEAEKPHDAYHPVGACRMGGDGAAVVDLALQVRGLENVSVVSTAVLPSAGTANPTFTMLCLAEELAERVSSDL